MSERYSRLFSLQKNLYAVGSPVVIAAGTLLKDNQTGKLVAQLKLRSISPKTIKAVKVSFSLFDTALNPIGEEFSFDYLDLAVSRDSEFGQKIPVPVAESRARSYSASVSEVVFADRSTWTASNAKWEPLPDPDFLQIHDPELLKQYKLRFGDGSTYEPKEMKDLWYCTCGALNHAEEACHCGNSLFELQTLDMEQLAKDKDARLAQEAADAAAKVAAKKAAAEAAKKKTAKTLKIVIPAVCAVIAIALLVTKVLIPNGKYNDAVALMEAGQYEKAIAAFEAMDGYKDSAEQIVNCENAIAAAEQARIEAEIAAKFARAEELLAAGDYDGAIALFESLSNAEGVERAETAKLEAAYRAAEVLAENGETAKAAIAFGKLGDYKNACERSSELWKLLSYPYETIGAGRYHTVALLDNGTVKATGHKEFGQCDTANWENILAISVGNTHTVGLKPDGTVIGTGSDYDGCLQIFDWTDIVFVSAGGGHTVGLNVDGTVVATGTKKHGQCNVSGWKDIIAISAGDSHTVGLKADGTVVAVGWNDSGQCDVSEWTDIIAISAGHSHSIGLKSDGTVVVAGSKMYNSKNQIDVSDWHDIVAISAGWNYAVGLKSDGTVVSTGYGLWSSSDLSDWEDIVAISAKEHHTVGLKADATIIASGNNKDNRCNVSSWKNIKLPN